MINVRLAEPADAGAIWEIFQAVIQTGDTYVYPPDTPREALANLWLAPTMQTYVAEDSAQSEDDGRTGDESRILGTYILKPNYPGRGSHVANASYMVHPAAQGLGVGTTMAAHSLVEARRLGFKAMQFNLVVSTNTAAIHLWQKLGFYIIGSIPKAFEHQQLGYVDAHIMYQSLEDGN
jgi:ribosomal protein S18 acetylase RimI-like enzyme